MKMSYSALVYGSIVMLVAIAFTAGYFTWKAERQKVELEMIERLYAFKKAGLIFYLDLTLDQKHCMMLNEITKWRQEEKSDGTKK